MKTKSNCEGCNRIYNIKSLRIIKGEFLCYHCIKPKTKMPQIRYPIIKLEQALEKIYEVRGYLRKDGGIAPQIITPQILIGHKVKLVLVD